jgi:NADH:ubiquinone oxidoreductase subunit C
MITEVAEAAVDCLVAAVEQLAREDWRLVSITGIDAGEAFELLYHFDRELRLRHLRVRLPKGRELPSITRVYYCAFVPENELQDFFGIKVANPVVDYGGHMFLSHEAPASPLAKRKPDEEVAR